MAERSTIEWCDSTFNPWIGCTKVSPACDHCYAERDFDHRFHVVQWGAGQERKRIAPANWRKPVLWNAQPFYECELCGWRGDTPEMGFPGSILENLASCPSCDAIHVREARRRVFCASLADWLDNEVPIEWLVDLLDLIRSAPNLDWLLLTKRIGNWQTRIEAVIREIDGDEPCELRSWLWSWINDSPPRNVWLGATICNQTEADRDIPKLLSTPAAVRFVSIEPMLGPVDLWSMTTADGATYNALSEWMIPGTDPLERRIDWVIVGGESGPKARPMHPDWARGLRDQCAAAGVPFLFKQWGEWCPRSACYHTFEDGRSLADEDPGATRWPCIRLNENGSDGRRLENEDGGSSAYMQRIGKKAAGRLLNGVEHNGFPGVQP